MLTSSLRFLQRNSLRIGAVLGTFALVAGFILVQQVREASAEQDFHAARAQVMAAQARASELDNATNVRAYRAVNTELKTRLSKLSLMIADQETTNKLVDQYAAQAAAQNQGDVGLARAGANAALAKVQGDLQTARIFSMDASVVDLNVQKLAVRLSAAATAAGLEQVPGGVMGQEKVLTDAMAQTLPARALTISLNEQGIPAYEHGPPGFWGYVPTRPPRLE